MDDFPSEKMFTIDFLMVFPWPSMFFHVFPMVFGVVFLWEKQRFSHDIPNLVQARAPLVPRRACRTTRMTSPAPWASGFGLGMSGDGQDAQLKNSIDANLLLDAPFKSQK